jgi:hypothetical protein
LIGVLSSSRVFDSWSSAAVPGGYAPGGLLGASAGANTISNSYATGDVTCSGTKCLAVGGFTVQAVAGDLITDSYATGKVKCLTTFCKLGGFAGLTLSGGTLRNVYATGPVAGAASTVVGGLVGSHGGAAISSFAAGPVTGGSGAFLGGLIGATSGGSATCTDCYWDTDTGRATSFGNLGTGKTTAQLQSALQTGFTSGTWGITKKLSYPFVNSDGFASNLATLVLAKKIYTALPINQTDKSQYSGNPPMNDQTSLAAVYTMVARAIGQTQNIASLDNVKIDKYFWKAATQTATFAGPATSHVTLGMMKPIAPGTPLNGKNVIGAFNGKDWVVLRGTYSKANGGTAEHYMLGTLYTKKGKKLTLVIANDPFTGAQVAISPGTKKVVLPANFPLADFTVNGYAALINIH